MILTILAKLQTTVEFLSYVDNWALDILDLAIGNNSFPFQAIRGLA
jgi:hypothetical protein